MKRVLYLSLVTMTLANVDVQNVYGSKEVAKPESPAPSPVAVAPSTQAVTPLDTAIGELCSKIQLSSRRGADNTAAIMSRYFGQNLRDVYATLSSDKQADFVELLEKAAHASNKAWKEFRKKAFFEKHVCRIRENTSEADAALQTLYLFDGEVSLESCELFAIQQPALNIFLLAMKLAEVSTQNVSLSLSCFQCIDDDSVSQFAEILGPNSIIERLALSAEGMSSEGYDVLAEGLNGNTSIEAFELCCREDIEDDNVETLIKALGQIPTLSSLAFIGVDMGRNSIAALANLAGSGALNILMCKDCNLGDDGATAIGNALKTDGCGLVFLDLSGNLIKNAGAIAIAEGLRVNRNLKFLNLEDTYVDVIGAEEIRRSVRNSKTSIDIRFPKGLEDYNTETSGEPAKKKVRADSDDDDDSEPECTIQ